MVREKLFLEDMKKSYNLRNDDDILKISELIESNNYRFETSEGINFDNMIYERTKSIRENRRKGIKQPIIEHYEKDIQIEVKRHLHRLEIRRRIILICCAMLALLCISFFIIDYYQTDKTAEKLREIANMKQDESGNVKSTTSNRVIFTDELGTEQTISLQVLQKYETLYKLNNNLIGWVKIDDTNIDFPVMFSGDLEFYLDHDYYDEYSRSGSIFMDSGCDIVNRSDNVIIYGHHMKSGNMFGKLDLYSSYDYYLNHKYIQFDTIYEEGLYEVMYVFRSRIFKENEIVFKYYQFIDAGSAEEFDSYMAEMDKLSLYKTGVTAAYSDKLLTLSTCDYQEKNGRFVVVAKKIN